MQSAIVVILSMAVCGAHAQYSSTSASVTTTNAGGSTTSAGNGGSSGKAWLFNHVIYNIGACNIPHSDLNLKGIALGSALWAANGQAAACGKCVNISANGNSVKATIFDKSDAPAENYISYAVYRALFPDVLCSSAGLPALADINVQVVAC